MSQEFFFRVLFSGIMGLAFAWVVFSKHDSDIGTDSQDTDDRQKYLPYISGNILPSFLLVLTILELFTYGVTDTARMLISMCFSIFLHISLFYLVLLLVLPILRKYISARACAMLWLLPNYLYIINQSFMKLPSPKWIITVPGKLAWILFSVWLAGFAAVLLWKIVDHLVFRHKVLKDSVPVSDPEVIAVWNGIIEDANMRKTKFRLVTSPHVATPLTIGLFRQTASVVLPKRSYSQTDLELILRHEIIHIGRGDAWNKFFLVFCTAMCWFNPLMWIAMRRSADDLELSCDETVLLNADEEMRKQYAILLLNTAGDERGFTTCLSASANAMRYRLRSITKPTKRRTGALIVGAVFFVLIMTSGYISLAYDGDTGANRIYAGNDIKDYQIRSISLSNDDYCRGYSVTDEAAIHEYLSGLELYHLSGNYSFHDSETEYCYILDTPEGALGLLLHDSGVKVVPLYRRQEAQYYFVKGGIDWDYLSTFIFERPAMNIRTGGMDTPTSLAKLWRVEEGKRVLLHQESYPEGEYHGLFTSAPFPTTAVFHTTYELAEPMTVLIENWDHTERYTITQTDGNGEFTIELPNYPAHYTIRAMLRGKNGQLYEAEFRYNIGDMNSN